MKIKQAIKLCVFGAGVLGAVPLLADEAGSLDPVQLRQQAQSMNQQERGAQREEMQNRVRNMTAEERQLMRETSYSGRAAMEGGESGHGTMTRERARDGSGSGSGNQYGRGFESRQGGGSSGGMHGGMGGGGGRGGRGR
jgi:hypothetical protein